MCVMLSVMAMAQETVPPPDTSSIVYDSLAEVTVTGFEQSRSLHTAPVVAGKIERTDKFFKTSIVNAVNTVAGVRMEERSPGSYRLNIRGSSLRSPFGVRNIKVYWNEIPITDPGGNTYFNQFAFNNFSGITIFKGPSGSLYGAGTGGLVLMESLPYAWRPGVSVEYIGGSYGSHNVLASANFGTEGNRSRITYAHNEQDGYRVQSAMRRDNVSWTSSFKISGRQELLASVLFTDMYYQTPGGLTRAEFDNNPRAARPPGGGLPGAEQARAAIYQKNFMAGIHNRYLLDSHWTNSTSLYVAYAQIRNPAVRNYERRSEPHAGGRTVFAWQNKHVQPTVKLVAGGELQQGYFNTKVYQNRQGVSDTLQTDDDIRYTAYSIFAQADLTLGKDWIVTAGTSLNRSKVDITRLNKYPVQAQSRTYKGEWAPRLTVLRSLGSATAVLATVSRGFSPPTVSEILPSTGVISTFLEAETGNNYELLLRQYLFRRLIRLELSGYYFRLENTLVQRRDLSGADFFINAGETRQKGIELSAELSRYRLAASALEYYSFQAAWAYSHFRYGTLTKDTLDFSGKKLPSVPDHTISSVVDIKMKNGLFTTASYYYASRIFLNDANTASAEPYHLLGWKVGWERTWRGFGARIYVGADNLLDEVYSLGNDINDARGRYFNTAARRNYYVGVRLTTGPKP